MVDPLPDHDSIQPLGQPLPALPSWLVLANVLAFHGFTHQSCGLLRRLSRAGRAYVASHHRPQLLVFTVPFSCWQDRCGLPRLYHAAGQDANNRYYPHIAAAWDRPRYRCAEMLLQLANDINRYRDQHSLWWDQDKCADFDWKGTWGRQCADPSHFWTTFVLLAQSHNLPGGRDAGAVRRKAAMQQQLGLTSQTVQGFYSAAYFFPGGFFLLIVSESPVWVDPNYYDALRAKLFAVQNGCVVEQNVQAFDRAHRLFTQRRPPPARASQPGRAQ
jgi:hypothetical protein